MPVVTADLHSALPAILAGIHADRPAARVAYVMTDGGALPAWFSRTLDGLRGHLAGTVTTGQAFGGDLEASTVHTGLLAARHVLRADVTVVTQGPGNLGTGTTWGFSGVAVGEAINAIGTLGGRPIGSLRISDGDGRPRHRGVSHHCLTAYGKVALLPADLPVPAGLPPAWPRRSRRAGAAGRAAPPGRGRDRRPGRGAARQPGAAVHDGPRPGRRTTRTSWPRPPPAGTRPRCSDRACAPG